MLCTRPWKAEPWGRWGFPPPPLLVSWFGFSLFFFSFLLSVGLGSFGTILVSSGSREESRVLVVSPLSIVSKFHLGTFKNRTKQQQKRRKLPPFSVLLQELIPGGRGMGGTPECCLRNKQPEHTNRKQAPKRSSSPPSAASSARRLSVTPLPAQRELLLRCFPPGGGEVGALWCAVTLAMSQAKCYRKKGKRAPVLRGRCWETNGLRPLCPGACRVLQ